jgi:hypothetical protein
MYTPGGAGSAQPHTATAITAVRHTTAETYAVSIAVQTADPNNSACRRDSATILAGFQLLAAGNAKPASN